MPTASFALATTSTIATTTTTTTAAEMLWTDTHSDVFIELLLVIWLDGGKNNFIHLTIFASEILAAVAL